jgi:hypothetical protein
LTQSPVTESPKSPRVIVQTMPAHRLTLQVLGLICIALAVVGGMIYPLNTMSIFEILAYVLSVSAGISGILFLLYRRGFGEEL